MYYLIWAAFTACIVGVVVKVVSCLEKSDFFN